MCCSADVALEPNRLMHYHKWVVTGKGTGLLGFREVT